MFSICRVDGLKDSQVAKGKSNLPALAAVIGFKERLIAVAMLADEQ